MIKSRYPAFPYIIFMAIFIIVPLIMVAYFAFTTSTGEFTMQNIIRVGEYIPVIIKSLFLAFPSPPSKKKKNLPTNFH